MLGHTRKGGASIYREPRSDAPKIVTLPGGVDVTVWESSGDFYMVRLPFPLEHVYLRKDDVELAETEDKSPAG
jgi:hypothetical protein